MTDPPAARTGRRDRLADLVLSTLLGVVALGPLLLHRGVALRGDMVFVPRQPWKSAWLGLDGSVARFVPGDAIVSAAEVVLPGDLLQKALLLGALVLAGVGAGRLVRSYEVLPRAAAIVIVIWNPWVLERLSIGQWGSVVGYAALPWLVTAAASLRADARRGWSPVVAWLGFVALWSPSAGLTGALTALCLVVVRPRLAPVAVVLGGAVVANLPWLLPSLLTPGQLRPTGSEFAAFAARGESSIGLVPSLLSFGGIWKGSVVPPERTLALVVLLASVPTVVALVAVVGRLRAPRPLPAEDEARATGQGLVLLASITFLIVLVPALGASTLDRATTHLPVVAIIRDSQRYLGPAVLLVATGIATVTEWLRRRADAGATALRLVAVVVVAWPVLCLPSMAWGLGGVLRPVDYPAEWSQAATQLHGGDTTVVLPWHGGYRGFAWNGHHAALDPAPRFFRGEVLIDDRLYVGDRVLGNEDPRLAAVTSALAADDPAAALRRLGVDHVLVEKGNGGLPDELPAGRVVHDGPGLSLVELGSATGSLTGHEGPARWPVVAGDATAGLVLLVSGWWAVRRRTYRV